MSSDLYIRYQGRHLKHPKSCISIKFVFNKYLLFSDLKLLSIGICCIYTYILRTKDGPTTLYVKGGIWWTYDTGRIRKTAPTTSGSVVAASLSNVAALWFPSTTSLNVIRRSLITTAADDDAQCYPHGPRPVPIDTRYFIQRYVTEWLW